MPVQTTNEEDDASAAYEILAPIEQTAPLIFASPHSGRDYPSQFFALSRLDPLNMARPLQRFRRERG